MRRTSVRRCAIASVLSALGTLGLCATASAAGQTDATCAFSAHVSFSTPITLTASHGSLSADSASWSCTGPIEGTNVYSNENFTAFGTYGETGGLLGNDSCTSGLEKLTAVVGPFPGGIGLNLAVNRTAVLLNASGAGSVGNDGLTLGGSGTFSPDVATGCLLGGWSSGWIRLNLSVTAGPYPGSAAVGGSFTETRHVVQKHHHKKKHHKKKHHRKHRHKRR